MRILQTRTFQWWEISLIKVCLISLGIIVGVYFYDYLAALMWLWWTLFIVIGVYFIARFISGK